MEFMTITEIASGLYRRNSTAVEYKMALALYAKLDDGQRRDVVAKGEALYGVKRAA